jgi:uncharacterized coiled-coil protein SlyX
MNIDIRHMLALAEAVAKEEMELAVVDSLLSILMEILHSEKDVRESYKEKLDLVLNKINSMESPNCAHVNEMIQVLNYVYSCVNRPAQPCGD